MSQKKKIRKWQLVIGQVLTTREKLLQKKKIPSDENVLVFTPVDCSVIDH